MTILLILIITTVFLAYSNGANDNFKGVSTLFGSGTTDYKKALWWGTITTFAGSICSVFLATVLIKHFSGKGLVPDMVATSPNFLIAVALGAGLTVIVATFAGFPISTTHSLTGALVGAGLIAVGSDVNFAMLGSKFLLPLLISPFAAIVLCAAFYSFFRFIRKQMGIKKESCLCAGTTALVPIPLGPPGGPLTLKYATAPELSMGTIEECQMQYAGSIVGISAQTLLNTLHYLSAGVVSFARGLNDTPKIVGLLIAAQALEIHISMLLIGCAMAIGGLLNARKVAETMSKKITPLNHGQGFSANLATGILVIFASSIGMPVSTTHVSVGSLFGLALITKKGDSKVISKIALSWVLTLPLAAGFSAFVFTLL